MINSFYTELHGVFLEVDCIERVSQRRYTLIVKLNNPDFTDSRRFFFKN